MKDFKKFIINETIRKWLLGGEEEENGFLPPIPPEAEELKKIIIKNDKDNKNIEKLKAILEKLGYTVAEIRILLRKK